MKKLFAIIIVLVMGSAQAEAQQWQAIKNADGIQVYASTEHDGPIIKIKSVAIIDANIERIRQVIEDVAGQAAWVPYLRSSRMLEQASANERLLYSEFDAPWPARDRDFVYRLRITHHADGHISYQQQSEQSVLMPEQQEYVRALLLEGRFQLVPVAENQTRVELLFHTDPKGKLPHWIANIVQRRFTFEALQALRQLLSD